MNIESFLDSLVLVKTTVLLIVMNLALNAIVGRDPLSAFDLYLQIIGHILIILTALTSIFLNYTKIKSRVKDLINKRKVVKRKKNV